MNLCIVNGAQLLNYNIVTIMYNLSPPLA